MNVYQRINAVMQKVSYIQKDATVQNYKAVTHDQVVAVCRRHLVEAGIVIYPEQIAGKMGEKGLKWDQRAGKEIPESMRLYEGYYAIHFVNMDDPKDEIVVKIEAHANDNGDKAPGKAVTYATKAAILKILCLETGENDESRAEQWATLTPYQAETIRKLINGDSALEQRILQKYEVEQIEHLQKSDFNEVEVGINAYRKKANGKAATANH